MKMDFGNMKKKVKEAFGKQDPIEMTQTEEKKKAAQIREASENLRINWQLSVLSILRGKFLRKI